MVPVDRHRVELLAAWSHGLDGRMEIRNYPEMIRLHVQLLRNA